MQDRLEATRAGQVAISLFVVVTLGAVVLWNLPASHLTREGGDLVRPYVQAAGLDQTWSVFAPEPRDRSQRLVARIDYEAGGPTYWSVPTGDAVVGAYRFYRWQKWMETVYAGNDATAQSSLARWLVEHHADDGRRPVRVTLVREWRVNPPPGSDQQVPWRSEAFFALDFAPGAAS